MIRIYVSRDRSLFVPLSFCKSFILFNWWWWWWWWWWW